MITRHLLEDPRHHFHRARCRPWTHRGALPSPDMIGVQNEVFSHDLQCVEYGPRKLQKTQFSLVPRLCLDDSTQTKPPACPHGVGGCSPRCRIAWNGLHHPRESILAPIDVLEIWTYGGLGMEKRLNCIPTVLNDKERWLKVSDGAMRPSQRFRVARSCTMVSRILCVVSTLENYYESKFGLS